MVEVRSNKNKKWKHNEEGINARRDFSKFIGKCHGCGKSGHHANMVEFR